MSVCRFQQELADKRLHICVLEVDHEFPTDLLLLICQFWHCPCEYGLDAETVATGGHECCVEQFLGGRSSGSYEYQVDQIMEYAALNAQPACMRLCADRGWDRAEADWLLLRAASGGDPECVRLCYGWGASNSEGALEDAITGNHAGCARFILTQQFSVFDENKTTPPNAWSGFDFGAMMQIASADGYIDCMRLVLEQDYDWASFDFDVALELASAGGYVDCMRLVLEQDYEWATFDFGTALEQVSAEGYVGSMRPSSEQNHEWTTFDFGMALAERTSTCSRVNCMRLILEQDYDWTTFDFGRALRETAADGPVDSMRLILEQNYDWTGFDFGVALERASTHGRIGCMRLIMEQDYDWTVFDFGRALKKTAANGHVDSMRLILEQNHEWTDFDFGGASTVCIAGGHAGCTWLCLEMDASYVNEALVFAARKGEYDCMLACLAYGASDLNGAFDAAVEYARDQGHDSYRECIKLCLAWGSDRDCLMHWIF